MFCYFNKKYSSSAIFNNFLFLVLTAKEKPPINVVGDVQGKIAIIVVSGTCFV